MQRRHRPARAALALMVSGFLMATVMRGGALASEGVEALAGKLIARAGSSAGVCAVLGSEDGRLPLALARESRLMIHVQEPDAGAVAAARRACDVEGLWVKRIVVEAGPLDRLPYADESVDLVIAGEVTPAKLAKLSEAEILRVLRPGGKAFVGGEKGAVGRSAAELQAWAQAEKAEAIGVSDDEQGLWLTFTKGRKAGASDWSHVEGDAGNNPVSADGSLRPPYRTQWLGGPYHVPLPTVLTAAGGRTFLACGHIAQHPREWPMLYKLLARNGYNGQVLWQRDLPEGYMVHRSAFIATADVFYMIEDDHVLALETETGKELEQIHFVGEKKLEWIALVDGTLYGLGGAGSKVQTKKNPFTWGGWSADNLSGDYFQKRGWGWGTVIAAYDLKQKKTLWTHVEEKPVDGRTMAVGGGKVFFYGPDSHAGCVDAASGQVVWSNGDEQLIQLIEEPGKGIPGNPGFGSTCMAVYTPQALIMQGQNRMNAVAISTETGKLLWQRKKSTNRPNFVYADGKLIGAVGPWGNHVVIDPISGKTVDDLKFIKYGCVRLTAAGNLLFTRGEGVMCYELGTGKTFIDAALRPACNDGVVPANGLLNTSPGVCDCNLSLIGAAALRPAGDEITENAASDGSRLQAVDGGAVAPLEEQATDWPTYRGDNARRGSTAATVAQEVVKRWEYRGEGSPLLGVPTAVGGLIFVPGQDGKVRAVSGETGELRWTFVTGGPVRLAPTIARGRAYVGSADGFMYVLEAATGRLLWRFRAAPVERRIMLYGALCSNWPVNSGVLVRDGTAYFAAGLIDHDGTYVYALDAVTGKLKWQNDTSGQINAELRKGVSVQGDLALMGEKLLLAGGNQVSPASYDLKTGAFLGSPKLDGRPQANRGEEVCVFGGKYPIVGGRMMYSPLERQGVIGSFVVRGAEKDWPLVRGVVAPAFDDKSFVYVDDRVGPVCADAEAVGKLCEAGLPPLAGGAKPAGTRMLVSALGKEDQRWTASQSQGGHVAVVLAGNAVVVAAELGGAAGNASAGERQGGKWVVMAMKREDGGLLWRQELPSAVAPGGLIVDRRGQVVVVLQDGGLLCYGKARWD